MQKWSNGAAVITGAGSGIGLSLAQECARRGMGLVIADLDATRLDEAAALLRETSEAKVVSVVCDVTRERDLQRLLSEAKAQFNRVGLLVNSAGILSLSSVLDSRNEDWEKTLATNLWSCIWSCRAFLDLCQSQEGGGGHILNVASQAGVETGTDNAAYRVSKHAVVCFTECLYYSITKVQLEIGVHVLCPGVVDTNLFRNSQERLSLSDEAWAARKGHYSRFQHAPDALTPEQVARRAVEGLEQDLFYIFTHDSAKDRIRQRMGDLLAQHPPTPMLLSDW